VTFEDRGEQQLKNIARPVRVYRVRRPGAAVSSRPTLPLPEKPSIAVLPFQNMSGDPAQDYFSDGITEDIITELSRFRSLFVVARNSSFSLRGNTVDVTDVGRRLGVRYVVEGSVRKAGNRVRVTIQLLEAASRNHLWGERYDRELEDIFLVQDEITRAIVSTLPGRLEDATRAIAKRKQTSNITAYDLVLLGNEHWRRLTRKDLTEALGYFRSAVALDPYYARVQGHLRSLAKDRDTSAMPPIAEIRSAHMLPPRATSGQPTYDVSPRRTPQPADPRSTRIGHPLPQRRRGNARVRLGRGDQDREQRSIFSRRQAQRGSAALHELHAEEVFPEVWLALNCAGRLRSTRAKTCSRAAKNPCHPYLAPW